MRRVSHLLDQWVTKPEKSLIVGRQIVQQLSLPELRYGFQQFVIGQGGDGLQDRHGDQPPDHRGCFEHLLGYFLKVVDARGNHGLHGRGQRDGVDSMFQPVGASLALEITAFRIALASSSMKNGLPCARSMTLRLSMASEGSSPICSRNSWFASAHASGSITI